MVKTYFDGFLAQRIADGFRIEAGWWESYGEQSSRNRNNCLQDATFWDLIAQGAALEDVKEAGYGRHYNF